MKKRTTVILMILSGLVLAGSCGCSRHKIPEEEGRAGSAGTVQDMTGSEPEFFLNGSGIAIRRGKELTIGFSQIGAESDWRLASSASMENTFSIENGYNLIFDNAQQKQENQIKAIREFIDQGVDYIVLDPIVETGWTSSLREAREAGIPVIIADREVKLEDESLYTAWIGSDFLLEGKRACAWLEAFAQAHDLDGALQILHIQGTEGSSAQIGRSQALYDAAEKNGWNILQSVCGDFVQAKGKEVAERALADCKEDVQVIYCENDNMAYGVIEALEDAGKKAGTDVEHGEILLISFDSASEGLSCTLDGTIAVDTECNPLYGPALSRMIMDLELGKNVEKKNYCEEEQFSAYEGIKAADIDGTSYPVTMVTEDLIKERVY
jgi:simple sugar transport system substrate-binding protein